jgi:hypothetical protein
MPEPAPIAPEDREPLSVLEFRVGRLETDMTEVKATLGRLEPLIVRIDEQLRSTLPHLATKAEVQTLRADMESRFGDMEGRFAGMEGRFAGMESRFASMEVKLADKPGKAYMWGVIGVMTASIFGAVVLGAALT